MAEHVRGDPIHLGFEQLLARRLLFPTMTVADALVPMRRDDVDQITQGSPKPVELPDHEDIPLAHEVSRLGEAGAFGLCAGDHVAEDVLATGVSQGIAWQVEVVFEGADTGIPNEQGVSFAKVKHLSFSGKCGISYRNSRRMTRFGDLISDGVMVQARRT
jgi:hypothetical protein